MKRILIVILQLFFFHSFFAQSVQETQLTKKPSFQIVNYNAGDSLNNVLENIDYISQMAINKSLVFPCTEEILKNKITNTHFLNALSIISRMYNLDLNFSDSNIVLAKKKSEPESDRIDSVAFEKQVNISAVLFEANLQEMNERGVNWQAIFSKHGLRIGSDYETFSQQSGQTSSNMFNLSIAAEGDVGPFSGYANAMFKFLESENLGEIISRLSVTVRDRQKGRMQVGEDISIKQLDFAGNVTDVFVPTGTIIEVSPFIGTTDTSDFALLKVKIERSSGFPDEVSTRIKKTSSETEVIMKDNEEAIIGGLIVNEEKTVRNGVPVLKDLPWWFLGLKYLFGYDQKILTKNEIVLLLNIEIIPPVIDQVKTNKDNLLQQQRHLQENEIKRYKSN